MTKIAIVGSRDWDNEQMVVDYVNTLPDDSTVVSGGARGVDRFAEKAARKRGLRVIVMAPNWDAYGKRAGIVRNGQIVAEADRVVAFYDGKSSGTQDTIDKAKTASKPLQVWSSDGNVQVFLWETESS